MTGWLHVHTHPRKGKAKYFFSGKQSSEWIKTHNSNAAFGITNEKILDLTDGEKEK